MIKKTIAVLVASLLFQCILADVFSQLQFIKIVSPTSGQSIQAGDTVKIKYVMQPLVFESTSNGFAKKLEINFHKRSGNKKEEKILVVDSNCPVAANKNSYKTYEKEWTVPADIIPGSYAFDFLEVAQTRRRPDLQVSETIKVHVVD